MPRKRASATSDFGDHSSSYWPTGWSFQRYLDATPSEINTLSEEEQGKVRQGFYDVLGDDGISKLADYLIAYKQAKKSQEQESGSASTPAKGKEVEPIAGPAAGETAGETTAEPPSAAKRRPTQTPSPNWLAHLQKRRRGQKWGFVVFRAACYNDSKRWEDFKAKFQQVMEIPFVRDASHDGVDDAQSNFQLWWVEDPKLADMDADGLRVEYKQLQSAQVPDSLIQELFLWITPEAVASLLDASEGGDMPTADSKRWRSSPPYALAVAANTELSLEPDDPERSYFKPVFKAAVETLIDELWWVLDSQVIPLRRITRTVKEVRKSGTASDTGDAGQDELEDVWWSSAPSPTRLRKRRHIA
ncbi:hypothetical protein BX600DRAFT_474830 [Xylariales sp. PMI_506]|nr:hypothetical protein BX600DRAFT_474830 [Xylariales sp. PMI_506]